MAHSAAKAPATKKRGGSADVKPKAPSERPQDPKERKLEEGLEESMAGSDPVSITQPSPGKIDKNLEEKEEQAAKET